MLRLTVILGIGKRLLKSALSSRLTIQQTNNRFALAALGEFSIGKKSSCCAQQFELINKRIPVRASGVGELSKMEHFAAIARKPGILDTDGILGFVLDATKTGVWTWDVATDLVRWSPEAYRIHGIEVGEFRNTGAAFFETVHPDDRERVHDTVSTAIRERRVIAMEFRILRPDGSVRMVTNRARATYDADGAIVVGTITDVTERQLQMQQLYGQAQEEKNRLALVLDNISEEVWFHDASGCVVLANAAAEKAFGELAGREITAHASGIEIFYPDGTSRPVDRNPIIRALAGEEVRELEELVKLPTTGKLHTRSVTSIPAHGPDGAVLGVVSVIKDITERAMADRALAESRGRLDYATRLSGIGFWYCDLPFDVLEWDARVKEHFFFEPTDRVTIEDFYARIHAEDREATRTAIDASIRNRAPYDIVYRTVHPKTGAVKWIRALGGTDYGSDGTPTHFDGVTVDVSAQKRDQERLTNLNRRLREQDRRKDEFIATLSHELRNPLAPIRAAAEVIASTQLTPEQLARAQAIIERQVAHMAALLEDLLDISRITQGKLRIKKSVVTLSEAIEAAIEAIRPTFDAGNHEFILKLPDTPILLEADLVRLSQILSNLLMNAAKYSEPSTTIELSGHVDGEMLRLSVKDQGIGIAAESIAGIFEMFSQIEGGSRSDGGLGIGLALVKGLTELHGGTIEARSDGLGLGSEFILRLPLGSQKSIRPPASGSKPQRASAPQRILIADDNHDAAESLSMLLALAGYEVQVANLGRAALDIAQAFRPDIALLDIGMPDMNGHEVARSIRQESWGKDMKLIAVTGWGGENDRRQALNSGFDHHVTKPVNLRQLEDLIETELEVICAAGAVAST